MNKKIKRWITKKQQQKNFLKGEMDKYENRMFYLNCIDIEAVCCDCV